MAYQRPAFPLLAIAGYRFQDATYCPGCIGRAITADPRYDGWALAPGIVMGAEDDLSEIAAAFGINRSDESTFNSGDFPKVVLAGRIPDGDACRRCGRELRRAP
jgi:hypothetical protein